MIVNQVAELSGVPPHVVRYYSRIGLLHPGRNPANGYKTFAPADIARVRFIRLARRLGYSLTDISSILDAVSTGRPVRATMRVLLHQHLAENVQQMNALARQLACVERALRRWRDGPEDRQEEERQDLAALCGFLETLLAEDGETDGVAELKAVGAGKGLG